MSKVAKQRGRAKDDGPKSQEDQHKFKACLGSSESKLILRT